MRYRELKVGMYITGKPNNGYPVTNQYSICKVLRIGGLRENIRVEVVQSNVNRVVGTIWNVDYRLFVKSDVLPNANATTPFPVDSYIIGNHKNCYGRTCRDIVCKVIDYRYDFYNKFAGLDSEYMKVAIVNADGTLKAGTFYVRPSWFDAYDYKPYKGLFFKAYYKKLFTISDDLIKVEGVKKDSPCYSQLVKECVDNGLIKKGD